MPVPSRHLRVGRSCRPRRGAPGRERVPDDGPAGDSDVTNFNIQIFSRFLSRFFFSVCREVSPRPKLVHAGQCPSRDAPRLVVRVRRPQRTQGPHATPEGGFRRFFSRSSSFPADERARQPPAGRVREKDDSGVRRVGKCRLLDCALGEVEVPAISLVKF